MESLQPGDTLEQIFNFCAQNEIFLFQQFNPFIGCRYLGVEFVAERTENPFIIRTDW